MYYANYLRLFEQARGLYIEEFGITLAQLAEKNCLFVCRRAEVDYHAPAILDDHLLIDTQITVLAKSYLTFEYMIRCQSRLDNDNNPSTIASGSTKMACCKIKEGRAVPLRMPKWLAETLIAGQNAAKS